MLQAYDWHLEIAFDNSRWEDTGYTGWSLEDREMPQEEIILKKASFSDVVNYMMKINIPCFHIDYTFLKHQPYIRYHRRYYMEEDERIFEKHNKKFSCRMVYKKKEVTLKEIFDSCPAEQAIQYMKERGLTTCPYGVEK